MVELPHIALPVCPEERADHESSLLLKPAESWMLSPSSICIRMSGHCEELPELQRVVENAWFDHALSLVVVVQLISDSA